MFLNEYILVFFHNHLVKKKIYIPKGRGESCHIFICCIPQQIRSPHQVFIRVHRWIGVAAPRRKSRVLSVATASQPGSLSRQLLVVQLLLSVNHTGHLQQKEISFWASGWKNWDLLLIFNGCLTILYSTKIHIVSLGS